MSHPSQCSRNKPSCKLRSSRGIHGLLTSFLQSAVMAGFKVVPVKSLPDGSLDLADLNAKAEKHKANLAACMVR